MRPEDAAPSSGPDSLRTESAFDWIVAPDPAVRARLAREIEAVFAELRPAPGLFAIPARAATEPAAGPAEPPSFAEWQSAVLVGLYASNPRPAFSKLPFDYRLVPSPVRALGLAILDRLHGGPGPDDDAFPSWPLETRADDLRGDLWARAAGRLGIALDEPAYPGGARGAVLLTHDIDSRQDIAGIAPIRDLERGFGLASSIGFIPEISWPARGAVEGLLADGCEVYCHDIRHDGKLPYLGRAAIRAAFGRFFDANPYARGLVRGFRSGQLLMNRDLLAALREFFEFDLSIPDSERGGPYGHNAGCGTVHPFLVDGLLEIPLTMPQDFYLANVERYDAAGTLALWRAKLHAIVERGGVAVVNTHPVWTNPRRAAVWGAYEGLLEAVAASGPWVTTPSKLADWLSSRRGVPAT